MAQSPKSQITQLLQKVNADADAKERLLELVYDELRKSARALMARERVEHTLQPTALVHEAYLRLVHPDQVEWTDRAQFYGIAARSMRQILVDHARAKKAEKRGGDWEAVTLDEGLIGDADTRIRLLDLDMALESLAKLDERASKVAELKLFGGMSIEEIASTLDVSKRTVDGDWAMARRWLSRELQED